MYNVVGHQLADLKRKYIGVSVNDLESKIPPTLVQTRSQGLLQDIQKRRLDTEERQTVP